MVTIATTTIRFIENLASSSGAHPLLVARSCNVLSVTGATATTGWCTRHRVDREACSPAESP